MRKQRVVLDENWLFEEEESFIKWISSTYLWVLDDQGSTPTPELNYEQLMAALDEEMGRTTIGADEGTSRKRMRTEDDAISSTGSDFEDVADIGDE
ncbi:hypothetical protein LINPERHAP1_LOCUS21655, partial [Linum perenne]